MYLEELEYVATREAPGDTEGRFSRQQRMYFRSQHDATHEAHQAVQTPRAAESLLAIVTGVESTLRRAVPDASKPLFGSQWSQADPNETNRPSTGRSMDKTSSEVGRSTYHQVSLSSGEVCDCNNSDL